MAKILVVEDDEDLCEIVVSSLKFEHFTVESTHDGQAAMELLLSFDYDLIILDWELPNLSGIEICQAFRAKRKNTPILMFTGKTQIAEKLEGFGSGADDYLTKPFHMDELCVRVKALLKRATGGISADRVEVGDIVLEPSKFRVTKADAEVRLLAKEFAILELLMRHPGKVFSAEALLSRVWTSAEDPAVDVVRTHIRNLRKKLGDESAIETVHGVGYKIEETKTRI